MRPAPGTTAQRAILLDKDGVLVDFHRTWKPAIKRAAQAVAALLHVRQEQRHALALRLLEQVGYHADTDSFLPGSIWAAGTQEELFDTWAGCLPQLRRQDIADTVSAILRATEPQPVIPTGELQALLRQARNAGCRLAIVTNDLTDSARATARLHGIDGLVDAIIGADLCARPKPHPDLVELATRKLRLPAQDMLMVGDNVHDAEMARNGGCGAFIGVLSGTSGHADLAPMARAVLPDVGDALRWALRHWLPHSGTSATPAGSTG